MPEHDDGDSSLAASTSGLYDSDVSPAASMSELYDVCSFPLASETAFEPTVADFSSPISVSQHDGSGLSELNDGGFSSAATSPILSELVSRPSAPSSSPHVGPTQTPPTRSQKVDSKQEKDPSTSSIIKESHNDSERMSARLAEIQKSFKGNFETNRTDVAVDKFLLFLLAIALPRKTHDIQELETTWKKILCVAVELCNEDQNIPIKPENEPAFELFDATSEAHMNKLQQLLLAYHNAHEPETARYASWVQLSNHVLEKLREPNVANRLTDIGLPQLRDSDESALIFQRNDGKQITGEDFGVDSRLVGEGPSLRPGVIALPIAAAVKMTETPSFEPDKSWETIWENHCSNLAPTTPHRASGSSDILLNVEIREQKGSEMKPIPLRYDEKSEVGDIKPCSLDSSSADESEFGEGTSDDEDATSNDEDATSENELGLEPSASTKQNNLKKRSRKPDESSAGRSKKKRRGNNGKVVSSGSGDENYESRSRPPKTVSRPPPPEQMAIYTAERLSSSVAVRHSSDFLVIDDRLWLWWFGREGAIQSHGLNFIANLPHFVALLAVLQRFSTENWGEDTIFGSGPDSKVKLLGPPKKRGGLRPEVEISVAVDKSKLALNLFSRASCVVPGAKCTVDFSEYGVTDSEYVVKIYFPDETCSNEADILGEGENGGDVRGHVPILLAERTWQDTSADLVESILGVKRGGGSDQRKRYRNLRILLFPKLLPISDLYGLDLVMAIRSILLCHAALWQGGVHHRDISQGDLMYTIVDGRICGVLNDFDLAIIVRPGDDRKPGEERTGTRIFMAAKLVENLGKNIGILHIYDFDVESIAYVTLWLTARYDNGSLKDFPPYSTWIKLDAEALCDTRRYQLYEPKHISPSNKKFAMVFETFFMEVHDHVGAAGRAERRGRLISPEPVEDVLRKNRPTARRSTTSY